MQDTTSTPDIFTIKDNQAQSPQLGSEYVSIKQIDTINNHLNTVKQINFSNWGGLRDLWM